MYETTAKESMIGKTQNYSDKEYGYISKGESVEAEKRIGAIENLVYRTSDLSNEAEKLSERIVLSAKINFGLKTLEETKPGEYPESNIERILYNLDIVAKTFTDIDSLLKEI
jgi:hypothetical protein